MSAAKRSRKGLQQGSTCGGNWQLFYEPYESVGLLTSVNQSVIEKPMPRHEVEHLHHWGRKCHIHSHAPSFNKMVRYGGAFWTHGSAFPFKVYTDISERHGSSERSPYMVLRTLETLRSADAVTV